MTQLSHKLVSFVKDRRHSMQGRREVEYSPLRREREGVGVERMEKIERREKKKETGAD